MKQTIVISIYRHAEVNVNFGQWCWAHQLSQFVEVYENAAIMRSFFPRPREKPDRIFVSTSLRSTETAKLMFGRYDFRSDQFCEAQLPELPFLPIYLPIKLWFVIARIAWFLGWSKNCESYRNFKCRSKRATMELLSAAETGCAVALIGHGFMNRQIAKELRSQGCHGAKNPSKCHLGETTYKR